MAEITSGVPDQQVIQVASPQPARPTHITLNVALATQPDPSSRPFRGNFQLGDESSPSRSRLSMPEMPKPVREAQQQIQTTIWDAGRTCEDLRPMEQFYFLRPDAQEVHGLQDWNSAEWAAHMKRHPVSARALLAALMGAEAGDNFDDEAHAVRSKLSAAMTMTQWRLVITFQNECLNFADNQEQEAVLHYMTPSLLSNMLFDAQFPLGVEEKVMRDKYSFAIQHSGLHSVQHRTNNFISCMVYTAMVGGILCFFCYLIIIMTNGAWTLEDTIQDVSVHGWSEAVVTRGRARGRVASLMNSLTFSLFINASLDKFGLIDPSTSTVLIGMTLGGTWGFLLDMVFGTDEGFREYLWSAPKAMQYAMGCLATARYGRYIVTILFDMFFTVILFKILYSKLVLLAGFTVRGREWIANGFVSTVLGVLTFEVYANMTRFQWAYPSGIEDEREPWISGPMMVMVTVIMNMVYLTTETRTRVGEPGINDPNIKIAVTCVTFFILWTLIQGGYIDPSDWDSNNPSDLKPANGSLSNSSNSLFTDVHLPLLEVCRTQSRAGKGIIIFSTLCCFCLGFVIFVTSAQSYSGLKAVCCGCASSVDADDDDADMLSTFRTRSFVRNPAPVTVVGNESIAIRDRDPFRDRVKGQLMLFVLFLAIVVVVVLFFSYVPFYSAPGGVERRNDDNWQEACANYDVARLAVLGLS